jgi:hypothetical protein
MGRPQVLSVLSRPIGRKAALALWRRSEERANLLEERLMALERGFADSQATSPPTDKAEHAKSADAPLPRGRDTGDKEDDTKVTKPKKGGEAQTAPPPAGTTTGTRKPPVDASTRSTSRSAGSNGAKPPTPYRDAVTGVRPAAAPAATGGAATGVAKAPVQGTPKPSSETGGADPKEAKAPAQGKPKPTLKEAKAPAKGEPKPTPKEAKAPAQGEPKPTPKPTADPEPKVDEGFQTPRAEQRRKAKLAKRASKAHAAAAPVPAHTVGVRGKTGFTYRLVVPDHSLAIELDPQSLRRSGPGFVLSGRVRGQAERLTIRTAGKRSPEAEGGHPLFAYKIENDAGSRVVLLSRPLIPWICGNAARPRASNPLEGFLVPHKSGTREAVSA